MQFKASVSIRATQLALERLGKRDVKAAANRAVTRAAQTVGKRASQMVTKDYAIRARSVKALVSKTRATGDALEAEVRISGRPIPLIEFGRPKQVAKGVNVTVRRSAGRTFYPHAFITKVRSTEQVFWRKKAGGRGKGGRFLKKGALVPRGPLEMLFGPPVARVLAAPARIRSLMSTARNRIETVMRQELRYRSSR